jgi:hypothetical protein
MSDSKGAGFFNEGTWILDATVFVDGGSMIELTASAAPAPRATAAPTLSALADDATAGAASKATQKAKSTLSAEATATQAAGLEGTATAEAEVAQNATATVEAQATAEAILTAQADWPLVAEESFTNTRLGWPTGKYPDNDIQVTAQLQSGKYLWSVVPLHGNSYVNILPKQGQTFGDFSAAVDIKFTQGSQDGNAAYGLVFRRINRDYGFFGVQPDGTVQILTVFGGGVYSQVTLGTSATHKGLGQTNRLTVRAIDSDFVFLVNDEMVWQLNEDFSPGEIGLGVDSTQKGPLVQVEFTNFEVHAPKE